MDDVFVTSSTYILGVVGITANLVLIGAIIRWTPKSLKQYSKLMLVSAICDVVGLMAVVGTSAREVVFDFYCFFEFHGICSSIGPEACYVLFGTQIEMYSTSVMLLCFCFFYRYCMLEQMSSPNMRKICLVCIPSIIMMNLPLGIMFSGLMINDSNDLTVVHEYRNIHSHAPQILGITNLSKTVGLVVLAYTVLTSFIPFVMSIVLRYVTIRKSRELSTSMSQSTQNMHAILVKVLNTQLVLTACYVVGCFFFNAEFFELPLLSNASILSVPFCNLQNVCTPIANLIIITPYRKKIEQIWKRKNTMSAIVVAHISDFTQSTNSQYSVHIT